ncbi:PhzF family phenazine biosynthesis protein [Idiomarina seosinensis]|uniref:PhzF family phenazine biosynthesis protein n=1 Tax=Idiomarina seosinensis TaxID=281739 RepID=UPI003850D01B
MTANQEPCPVDVFYGPGAAGNRHRIVFRRETGRCGLPVKYQKTANIILLSGGIKAPLQAQFYNEGRPVKRCGSGNLAIIAYVSERLRPISSEQCLITKAGEVSLGFDQRSAYYRDTPLTQRPLTRVKFWQQVVRQRIINGSYCGGRNDYVLLETGQPLAHLHINTKLLCQFSRRALIVIYRPCSGALQLRYFAPQYGPAEDAATGSACVQAAGYLRRHYPRQFLRQLFEVNQCSPAGGCLYLKSIGRQVLVRGRTAVGGKNYG